MITGNMAVAAEISRYIDTKLVEMKDRLAKQQPKDQYMDTVQLWIQRGGIQALESLKRDLTAQDGE